MSRYEDELNLVEGSVINKKYVVGRTLGHGAFGMIYAATHVSNGQEYAIKIEPRSARHPQLEYEYKLYLLFNGGVGVPRAFWYGKDRNHNVLVIERHGKSLEGLFNDCGRQFSVKTVLMLADQLILRLEYLHSKTFLHRDIKPDNFLMGRGRNSDTVYAIDFGLSKRFQHPRSKKHISFKTGKSLTGTARYASIGTHEGYEQGRRDDMEAMGHVFFYFLRGRLPWQGLPARDRKEKYNKIMNKKKETAIEDLCEGFPPEFAEYLVYARALRFEEQPDYAYLRRLFRGAFERLGYEYDFDWDWLHVTEGEGTSTAANGEGAAEADARRGDRGGLERSRSKDKKKSKGKKKSKDKSRRRDSDARERRSSMTPSQDRVLRLDVPGRRGYYPSRSLVPEGGSSVANTPLTGVSSVMTGSCFDGSLGNLAPIGESASGEGGSGSGRRGRPRRNTHSTGLLASQHRVGSSAGARRSGSGDLPSLEEEGASGGGGGGTGAPVLIINPATGRRVGGTRSRPRRNSERIRGSSGENVRNHLATAEIPERTVIRSSTRHAPGLGSGSSAERLRDNGAAAREPRKRRRSSQRKASR